MPKSSYKIPVISYNDKIIIKILLYIFIIMMVYLTLNDKTTKKIIKSTLYNYFNINFNQEKYKNSNYMDTRILYI